MTRHREGIQAADGTAASGVANILHAVGGQGSDAVQDAGVLANVGGVPGYDDAADVVDAVCNPPLLADGRGGTAPVKGAPLTRTATSSARAVHSPERDDRSMRSHRTQRRFRRP